MSVVWFLVCGDIVQIGKESFFEILRKMNEKTMLNFLPEEIPHQVNEINF